MSKAAHKMSRKGTSLPMETVVIAGLALVVLIVLILIFTGNMGKTNRALKDCTQLGGTCCLESSKFDEAACHDNRCVTDDGGLFKPDLYSSCRQSANARQGNEKEGNNPCCTEI